MHSIRSSPAMENSTLAHSEVCKRWYKEASNVTEIKKTKAPSSEAKLAAVKRNATVLEKFCCKEMGFSSTDDASLKTC